MLNKMNGAVTQYQVAIVSKTQIYTNDLFKIDFPPEIGLPFDLKCTTSTKKLIQKFSCQRLNEKTVHFLMLDVNEDNGHVQAGFEIQFNIENVRNAPSLRTSSSFTNMIFTDSVTNLDLAEFSQEVFVTTTVLGIISSKTAAIT
tara:strand:- start:5 stop:436 length:432 start_codon:yes stop_codon:yes gene_type:complete